MGVLTDGQKAEFLDRGYIKLEGCFSREGADELIAKAWIRLGMDPGDESTWTKSRIHMPTISSVDTRTFAPEAYAAAAELCGGEDRIETWGWGDGFIVSLNDGADMPWDPPNADHGKWHKDGDFFRHFLDSPEQGLLSLVIWSDIDHQGSATFAAPESVPIVSRFLAEHPEGVVPGGFNFKQIIAQCSEFVECTGRCGDVFLLHPFMMHSGSQNMLKRPRFLTNPPVHLKEPMNFNRADPDAYSLIELAVLRGLGVDRYDFHAAAPREKIVPERVRHYADVIAEEKRRLAAVGAQ